MHPASRRAVRSRFTVTAALIAGGLLASFASAGEVDLRGIDSPRALTQALIPLGDKQARTGETLTLRGLPVGGLRLDLELERFEVWSEDAIFLIDDQPAERPAMVLWRGSVAGEAGSSVVIGVGEFAANGYIRSGGKAYSLSSGPFTGQPALPEDVLIADMSEFAFAAGAPACGVDPTRPDRIAIPGLAIRPVPGAAPSDRGTAPCRVARIAIDTDYEWTLNRFGGNANASAEYAMFLMAAVGEIFRRDVNVRLVVPFLRTFSSNIDPYNGTTTPDPLDQVMDHWRAAMGHVQRDAVHLFTGASTGYGGIAYVNALCWNDWHFAVSSYLNGSFPYPLLMNSHSNWDLVVVAHELGHNFGTFHTHDGYEPPLDRCGIDCTGNLNSTIMSYCHICSGGLMNIDLRFHPVVQARILEFLANEAPCNLQAANAANDDSATTYAGLTTDIFVLANDSGPDCNPVGIQSVQSPTALGAAVQIVGWNNPTGNPTGRFLRYVSPPGASGLDSFTYTTTAGQTATVSVQVFQLRPADTVNLPTAGLRAAWYSIGPTSSMPDFSTLTPIQEGVVANLNYWSTNGNAVGGPLADHVGAVFQGYVVAPGSGVYTFSLESDDGSMLYVGDDLVVNNDGLHGMQTASGQIGLQQGAHRIRVEFFENTGGAGLIYRWSGPGGISGVVPPSALIHSDIDCGIADLAEPFGVLDLQDINLFIFGFSLQHPDVDLAPPFGVFDLADVIAFLDAFNAGCN